ncbi:MAG: lipopolysaccharide heptosyltransferase II [Nitrospiraceae bacterium]
MPESIEQISISDVRRLLLIKPSSLGDIVHALPIIPVLRARFPQAEVSWLVKEQWADILERVEGIDRIWKVKDRLDGWIDTMRRLRSHRFDLVIDLQGLLRSGVLAWRTGCSIRVGFENAREGSPWFYTHCVSVPNPDIHAVDRYLTVARYLGCSIPDRVRFPFVFTQEHEATVRDTLSKHGVGPQSRWAALNVSARWPTKRWPRESFVEVANRLLTEGWDGIIVIGGAEDRVETESVIQAVKGRAVNLAGQIPLRVLPALLRAAGCLITNDSGPMHVAAAVGTPVVALFGPTSEIRTGPYGLGHDVCSVTLPCRPCFSRICRQKVHLECLTRITPAEVVRQVHRVTSGSAVSLIS